MRHVCECCCGANATFDAGGSESTWVLTRVQGAYDGWMAQHSGCPALYAPKPEPTYREGTGPFADFRIEVPAQTENTVVRAPNDRSSEGNAGFSSQEKS